MVMKKVTILKIVLPLIALCFVFNACSDYLFKDWQELVVVSKTPMGAYAEGNNPADFHGFGWYNIGLSRSGEEPIEYIWRAGRNPQSYAIMKAKIGERGIVRLNDLSKENKWKLPRPNAKNPPVVGALREVSWEQVDPVSDSEDRAR